MTKILVSDSLSKDGLEILKNNGEFQVDFMPEITPEELVQKISDYDALVIRSRTKATADVLKKGKNLKVVGRAGVGLDNVDLETATQLGIIVMNTPGGNTISAAEQTMSLMLALARKVSEADQSMKAGKWDKKKYTGTELCKKTLGIIGLGRIGREVAKRAQGFDMRVVGYDPYVAPDVVTRIGVESVEIEELIKMSDIISVHTALNDETRGLISKAQMENHKVASFFLHDCIERLIISPKASDPKFQLLANELIPVICLDS